MEENRKNFYQNEKNYNFIKRIIKEIIFNFIYKF